jgi:hypothetical protein
MDEMWHVIVPHHVLNDYCPKQLVHNDLRLLIIFVLYDWNNSHKLNHTFDNFF